MAKCFNPRPRTEGDHQQSRGAHARQGFNPRPRTEGDREPEPKPPIMQPVSIHAPARRATHLRLSFRTTPTSFNPRPRTEGDSWRESGYSDGTMFQSTPPHGGRRVVGQPVDLVGDVSIHAPARRATQAFGQGDDEDDVSIHAPARRATRDRDSHRRDRGVSIHAPARRATASRGH